MPLREFLSPRVLVIIEILCPRRPPTTRGLSRLSSPRSLRSPQSPRPRSPRQSQGSQSGGVAPAAPIPELQTQFKRIGWCFFRPISDRGNIMIPTLDPTAASDINSELQLQLFEFQRIGWIDELHARTHWQYDARSTSPSAMPAVFLQHQQRTWSRLSAHLVVELRPVVTRGTTPRQLSGIAEQDSRASQGEDPTEDETGGDQRLPPVENATPDADPAIPPPEIQSSAVLADDPLVRCRRETGEACLVPQRVLHRLATGRQGCSSVAFSVDGLFLAAAVHNQTSVSNEWLVQVYQVSTGAIWQRCRGHHAMIHALEWSSSHSSHLISASSDGTVCLWTVQLTARSGTSVEPLVVWQHIPGPVFVYSAVFHPVLNGIIVSGASDGVVRCWRVPLDLEAAQQRRVIAQPVASWKAPSSENSMATAIHCTRIEAKSGRLFCGHSNGDISVWTPGPELQFQRSKTLTTGQSAIASMQLHPRKPHLIVLAQPHTLLHFELRSFLLLHKGYNGVVCQDLLVKSGFSPDGRFVVAGSQDGVPQLFQSLHGQRQERGVWGHRFFHGYPVMEIAWNPRAHIVALCAYGGNHPVVLLGASREDDVHQESALERPTSALDVPPVPGLDLHRAVGLSSPTTEPSQVDAERLLERRRQRLQARLARELDAANSGTDQRQSSQQSAL
ncbi:hypothetical protein PINS_up001405 [Pythium insidiosum]|nr:hypothetical protein PINS_up001405 [Pythium insidiosum]